MESALSSVDWLQISALLDFGNSHYSCLLFDFAASLAYMMMEQGPVAVWERGGWMLAGYRASRKARDNGGFSHNELIAILYSTAARLAQVLIMLYKNTIQSKLHPLY